MPKAEAISLSWPNACRALPAYVRPSTSSAATTRTTANPAARRVGTGNLSEPTPTDLAENGLISAGSRRKSAVQMLVTTCTVMMSRP